jgi:hypothetical protein
MKQMKQQMFTRLPLLVTLILLLAFGAFAQQQTAITGGLNGAITDPTGAVVPGATVTLSGPQGKRVLTTDSTGRYSVNGLTPGTYSVTVEKAGFKKAASKNNEVVVNSSSTLNLTLQIGNATEVVEVNASAVSIDTQSTAITQNLTDTFYESIPMPRNVTAIFYAAPGVATGEVAGTPNEVGPGTNNPSIGGASGLENLYVVDGVTITDQAFGSIGTFNRYFGSLGTGINLAYIKEVDVKTTAFEPQYGKATGGIVQIVTKSGSNQYHGAIGAYFGPGSWYADRYQYDQFGYVQESPSETLSQPQYDVSAEFGGYVPTMKDKLFFFGAIDPGLRQSIALANPANLVTRAHGSYALSTTTFNWAGKLTYKWGSSTTIEASSFGDPSKRNAAPRTLATSIPLSVTTGYTFGSRDSVIRLNTTITPTWVADVSYTYNYNHFTQVPTLNLYQITDNSGQSLSTPVPASTIGYGAYEPSKNDTYSIALNTSKTFNAFGQHTLSFGYSYDHTNFLDQPSRSGPLFPIPTQNANGTSLVSLFPSIPAKTIGAMTNAQFQIFAANTDPTTTTTDHTCALCPINGAGQSVYATIVRGTYVGLDVSSIGRYHTGYGNDVWRMNRYVTLNAGLRWEAERVAGTVLNYSFGGSWSPRLGIDIDPFGDQKGKIFFNYGRNYWAMPLDAAIRQLGNEQDDTNYIFAPIYNAATGTYTVIPDAAHNLNGLARQTVNGTVNTFGKPSFASSTGEGIIPGTKGEFEDEYVLGIERELPHGMVVKLRYTDRRLKRIVEDIGSQSPEGSTIGGNYTGGITNPNKNTDIAVNEQEITYTPAQYFAANPPGSTTYAPPVPGCTAANDTVNAIGGLFINGRNQQVGGACFLNLATMDAPPGDGIPDGFVNPQRHYEAFEAELDKRFSNHWMATINFRWGSLWGNYEGAYRNDNGQSDPGISSLFDFTAGSLGLLGDQFRPGFLSTDRRTLANVFLSYTIASDTPFVRKAKGLTIGAGLRSQSGVPLSFLGDHPIYLNQGEVPIGGRGAAGRTPVTSQLDMHADYLVPMGRMSERWKLKLQMDLFNVTNSQFETGRVQFTQQGAAAPGVAPPLNLDYGRPTSFQGPFYARGSVRVEF